ncbi:putative ABC-type antimicrobial peptide transport system permease component domain protein [Burkholderia glumae LMG 2196 = ATCC 33617]|nr:putative ABC-type antimicrobial peptide transport system permease component domain protein [Burkholderia glumae LMG 2196 = ATCC 33617]
MSSGRIEDIYAENGFIAIDDTEFRKLGTPTIGTDFDLNDHRGVIVGIAKVAASGLFGTPTLYTTYARAVQYIPSPRFTISYILVEPKSPADIPRIKAAVSSLGYLAYTREEFIAQIARFYKYQTGFGTNILLMTVISFLIGLSISGQTFYAFILENLDKFGALEAIGANNRDLVCQRRIDTPHFRRSNFPQFFYLTAPR